jgi:predicted TIM-barrel fold metal-dependent hydrolase
MPLTTFQAALRKAGPSGLLILTLLCPACAQPSLAPAQPSNHYQWRADHHMHLGSPDICARLGDCLEVNQPSAVYAADAVAALDQAQVQRGVVISSAYLYGWDELGLDDDAIASWMRRENEFTAAQVRKYPGRLVGFLSVDPLRPNAIPEIRHWQDSADLIGLKLHFTPAGLDLQNPGHRASLKDVLEQAAAQGLPLLIHIGGGDFAAAQTEIFITEILPFAAPSKVQIAHAGGGMPLVADNHLQVLRTLADHIQRGNPGTENLWLDLSYVPAEGEDAQTVAAMVVEMRRIGVQRFLFGSDFNVLMPTVQIDMLQRLGLSGAEMQTLRNNCAPWVCGESPPPD